MSQNPAEPRRRGSNTAAPAAAPQQPGNQLHGQATNLGPESQNSVFQAGGPSSITAPQARRPSESSGHQAPIIYHTPQQASLHGQFSTQPGGRFIPSIQNPAPIVPHPAHLGFATAEQYALSQVGSANSSFGLEQARMQAEIAMMVNSQQSRNNVQATEANQRNALLLRETNERIALMEKESAAKVKEIEACIRDAETDAAHRLSIRSRESEARIRREEERHKLEMEQIRQRGVLDRQLMQEESKRAYKEYQPPHEGI